MTQRARIAAAMLGLAHAAAPLAAQPASTAPEVHTNGALSLPAAVELALAQHPSPAAAQAAVAGAQARAGEARAAWWPSVHLQATATQNEQPVIVLPLHELNLTARPVFDETVFHGSVIGTYTLFDGGARGARIRLADAEAGGAAAGMDATAQALAAHTIAAYLDVQTRREVLEAQDQRHAALEAERNRVLQRLDAGRAARVELLRVEAALARADAERVQSAERVRTAAAELGRLIALQPLPELTPVALADTTLPDRSVVLGTALDASPEVAQARAQQSAADAGADLARSTRWPELRAQGMYQGWSDNDGNDALEWNAGLQLDYPLFTGGARRRAIEGADADRRGADATLQSARLQVEADLDRALQSVVEARARVQSFGVAVQRSTEVARIETLTLETGSGTQTDWLLAQAELLEARAGLVEARHGEIAARAELARVAGRLDADWIARTLETSP